jgi:hypothetical protein
LKTAKKYGFGFLAKTPVLVFLAPVTALLFDESSILPPAVTIPSLSKASLMFCLWID